MKSMELKLTMGDGHESIVYKWEPDENKKVVGIIQIVHGSVEHSKRYVDFANFLTDNGYIVYSSDLRGHGLSAERKEDLGYFAESNGWDMLVEDIYELTKYIKNEHNGLKIVILGHSMGSFLARHYAMIHGTEIDGLIATGTAHNPKLLLKLGKFLAERDIKKNGSKNRNMLLNKMSYDSFSNQFKPIRTKQDWLTRDAAIVDRYIADELCGYVFTSSAFRDMFSGLLFITDRNNIAKTPKNLPFLLLSGKRDPVGGNGKMVEKAYEQYKKAGLTNIQMKLYEDMRHEILNEIDKEKVYEDILAWINNI
jgi:alpha-beta hydrolase superfamily lysophospholipase